MKTSNGTATHVVAAGRTIDIENAMAEVDKGQQLAGHFPDAEALERGRRVLVGEISEEDAMNEIRRKYHQA